MSSIFWTAYSNEDRLQTIDFVKEAVARHGDIVGFKFFSDISAVITIEIEERNIDRLYQDLKELLQLDAHNLMNSESKKERILYLNITFALTTGDLRIEVPHVPG